MAYMYSCGVVGQERADEVLLRVPLRLQDQNSNTTPKEVLKDTEDGVVGTLKEVNRICHEYGREETRRAVCRVGISGIFRPCISDLLADCRSSLRR